MAKHRLLQRLVPILDRPERRSQSPIPTPAPQPISFQSSIAPKDDRNMSLTMTAHMTLFQSSIAPKDDRNLLRLPLRVSISFVPILDRPERRSQFVKATLKGIDKFCSNPRSPRKTIAINPIEPLPVRRYVPILDRPERRSQLD